MSKERFGRIRGLSCGVNRELQYRVRQCLMPNFLVEKKVKQVFLRDKQKYAYILTGSPHIMDVNNGVIEC